MGFLRKQIVIYVLESMKTIDKPDENKKKIADYIRWNTDSPSKKSIILFAGYASCNA